MGAGERGSDWASVVAAAMATSSGLEGRMYDSLDGSAVLGRTFLRTGRLAGGMGATTAACCWTSVVLTDGSSASSGSVRIERRLLLGRHGQQQTKALLDSANLSALLLLLTSLPRHSSGVRMLR